MSCYRLAIWVLLLCLSWSSASAEPAVLEKTLHDSEKAETYSLKDLRIVDPWGKVSIGEHHLKLFFEFHNLGSYDDKLIGATASVAQQPSQFLSVGVDEHGNRSLTEIEAISIPTGSAARELTELGFYIQLNGLVKPLLMGSKVAVELLFEKAGAIKIDVAVRFHSPKLTRRIKEAVRRGDIEALKTLRPVP